MSLFRTLWPKPSKLTPPDLIHLFGDCIRAASSRTQEYLLFRDPENKFHPESSTLCEIFLMTFIQRSEQLNLSEGVTCTAMTPEQKVLLGADWVWAILDHHSRNPKIQIAIQVLHLPRRTGDNRGGLSVDVYRDIMRLAGIDGEEKTRTERMVDFCSSVSRDCYALFLLFGRQTDEGNIYGLLSNNLHAALGKCVTIDQSFIDYFFKGAKCFVNATGMLQGLMGVTFAK
ncbi:hypothetical protein DNTS_013257 [Danionella cerebrum]|uniref:Rab15 effector protein n=1 Tax=Danionella cerebrum TaxID=2873325 RepID=A0A553Q723_9TELE|nr:hypothetical protein DNTS_013257 [Danionella translucida]